MIRTTVSICVLVTICLAGCFESHKTTVKSGGSVGRIDACAEMVKYLQDQNLPALEKVEVWDSGYGPAEGGFDQAGPRPAGLKLTTAHYEIFTTLLEPLMLCRIPLFMESAYRGYNDELPGQIETTTRFTIYLFASRQQWVAFTKSFAGEDADLFCRIKAGAYYLNGACVAYNIGSERTFSVLGHEGWHQFNSRCFKFRLPSWLDEGVATLFESSKTEKGIVYFEPSENTYRLDVLKKMLGKNRPKAGLLKPASGAMIPLKELIAINPSEVLATNESEEVRAFLSQSYALVRFLREGGFRNHPGNYRRLLSDGLKGNWPLDEVSKKIAEDRNQPQTVLWNRIVGQILFQQYIGSDFDQIEQEYLAFCRQIVRQK